MRVWHWADLLNVALWSLKTDGFWFVRRHITFGRSVTAPGALVRREWC